MGFYIKLTNVLSVFTQKPPQPAAVTASSIMHQSDSPDPGDDDGDEGEVLGSQVALKLNPVCRQ